MRRTAVALALALVVTGVAAAIGGGLAAVLGGLVAGVGAVDLVNRAWVLGRERETGLALYRELGPVAVRERPPPPLHAPAERHHVGDVVLRVVVEAPAARVAPRPW